MRCKAPLAWLVLNLAWKMVQSEVCFDYGFTSPSGCKGKRGTTYQLATVSSPSRAGCAVDCLHHRDCALFFYNTGTLVCSLHSQLLAYLSLVDDPDSSCYQSQGIAAQWISSIVSATYTGPENYPVGDMVGDTTGHYDATGNEVIIYSISSDAYLTKLEIDESDGRRPFGDVSILQQDGSWLTVWGGTNYEKESAQRFTTANLMRMVMTSLSEHIPSVFSVTSLFFALSIMKSLF